MDMTDFQRDKEVLSFLEMFGPMTHSIECRSGLVREYMVEQGLIVWVPPIFGSDNQYTITPKGWEYRKVLRHDIDEYLKNQRS